MKMDAMEMDMIAPTWGLGGVLMIYGVFWNDLEEVWLQCCSRAWARVSVGVAVQDLEVAAIAPGPLCQRPTCLTDLISETLFREDW